MDEFNDQAKYVVKHIHSRYTEEMSKKTEVVSVNINSANIHIIIS